MTILVNIAASIIQACYEDFKSTICIAFKKNSEQIRVPFVCRHDLKTKTGNYTKTETENISKLTAYTNLLICWRLVFVFYRFKFLLLHSFCFFFIVQSFELCYCTIIKNQKLFVSKTNLRRSFASNNILQFLNIVLIRCNSNTTEKCIVFSYPGYTETRKTQLVKNSHCLDKKYGPMEVARV